MIDFDPLEFAADWVSAWNAKDVEEVLRHFHDDAVFDSPIALRLGHGNQGRVRGKEAIRRYWVEALAHNPDLHFELEAVQVGVDILTICFRNQDGISRVEVLEFRDGLVSAGHGMMPAVPCATASAGQERP